MIIKIIILVMVLIIHVNAILYAIDIMPSIQRCTLLYSNAVYIRLSGCLFVGIVLHNTCAALMSYECEYHLYIRVKRNLGFLIICLVF